MSTRVKLFKAANIVPQTTCNYTILIPSIWRSPLAIESSSLPFKKTLSTDIWIRGIKYSIPVKQTMQGTWSCTMVENLFMGTLYQSLNKWNVDIMSNAGSTEYISAFKLGKIYIYITDALTGTAPVAVCILDDCYLTGIKEVPLRSNSATDIMKYILEFQYNGIIDPITTMDRFVGKVADTKVGKKIGLEAGLDDGGVDSVAAIESGVLGITAAAWGVSWAAEKGAEKIEDLLRNGE